MIPLFKPSRMLVAMAALVTAGAAPGAHALQVSHANPNGPP